MMSIKAEVMVKTYGSGVEKDQHCRAKLKRRAAHLWEILQSLFGAWLEFSPQSLFVIVQGAGRGVGRGSMASAGVRALWERGDGRRDPVLPAKPTENNMKGEVS